MLSELLELLENWKKKMPMKWKFIYYVVVRNLFIKKSTRFIQVFLILISDKEFSFLILKKNNVPFQKSKQQGEVIKKVLKQQQNVQNWIEMCVFSQVLILVKLNEMCVARWG